MLDIFNKIFDLIREAKGGSSWLFALLVATLVDVYVMAHFDRSLADFIMLPQALVEIIRGRELTEVSLFVIMFVVTWFYFIPVVCVPSWKWVAVWVNSKMKMTQYNWPTTKRGFIPLLWAERRAITQNNSLLFQRCIDRHEAALRRDRLTAYMLGTIIFSSVAWVIATPESTCLLCLLGRFFSGMNQFLQILFCIASLPAVGVAIHILFYDEPYDDYLYLPELVDEYEGKELTRGDVK